VIVLGTMFSLSSLFADQIALGMPGSGFGLKQLAGTVIGLAIVAGGLLILRKYPLPEESPERERVKDEEA
jgi:hypothetical protein